MIALTNQDALDGLHLALDENPNDFALRLILADLYEEAGEELTARAIRWQVENQKRPIGGLRWFPEDPNADEYDPPSDLPNELWDLLEGNVSGDDICKDWLYREDAEEALWRAWAKWKGLA